MASERISSAGAASNAQRDVTRDLAQYDVLIRNFVAREAKPRYMHGSFGGAFNLVTVNLHLQVIDYVHPNGTHANQWYIECLLDLINHIDATVIPTTLPALPVGLVVMVNEYVYGKIYHLLQPKAAGVIAIYVFELAYTPALNMRGDNTWLSHQVRLIQTFDERPSPLRLSSWVFKSSAPSLACHLLEHHFSVLPHRACYADVGIMDGYNAELEGPPFAGLERALYKVDTGCENSTLPRNHHVTFVHHARESRRPVGCFFAGSPYALDRFDKELISLLRQFRYSEFYDAEKHFTCGDEYWWRLLIRRRNIDHFNYVDLRSAWGLYQFDWADLDRYSRTIPETQSVSSASNDPGHHSEQRRVRKMNEQRDAMHKQHILSRNILIRAVVRRWLSRDGFELSHNHGQNEAYWTMHSRPRATALGEESQTDLRWASQQAIFSHDLVDPAPHARWHPHV